MSPVAEATNVRDPASGSTIQRGPDPEAADADADAEAVPVGESAEERDARVARAGRLARAPGPAARRLHEITHLPFAP
eukprot:1234651-Heterocapsa_arctica.AAC.1